MEQADNVFVEIAKRRQDTVACLWHWPTTLEEKTRHWCLPVALADDFGRGDFVGVMTLRQTDNESEAQVCLRFRRG